MQEFQDISEISGHSGQILKFQEFQDNAQAWHRLGMLLKHFTLKNADALTAACVGWAQPRPWLHNRRRQSEMLCATCGCVLWRR